MTKSTSIQSFSINMMMFIQGITELGITSKIPMTTTNLEDILITPIFAVSI
ncbi:MAG: hypothetical protein WBV84_13300 [Nitrososphaeraceae archaeon]